VKFRHSLATLAVIFISSATYSTTIIPMSVERLTQVSTNVVEAQAVDSWTELSANQSLVYTLTRFRVGRSLKGQAGETITVRQIGGRTINFEQKVAGVRQWQSGDRTVLFLRPSNDGDGTLLVTGLMQGDFRVIENTGPAGEAIVSNGIAGVHTYDPSQKTVSEFGGARMSLKELEARVKKAQAQ
jgi:hypothetical protein